MAVVGTAFAGLAAMPASAAGGLAGTGSLSAAALVGPQREDERGTAAAAGC